MMKSGALRLWGALLMGRFAYGALRLWGALLIGRPFETNGALC